MYAHDTKICREMGDTPDCIKLQVDSNNEQKWSDQWRLKFNSTVILAVNRQFLAKGPKIASDKSAFLCGRLTFMYGYYGQLLNVMKKRFSLWVPRTYTIIYLPCCAIFLGVWKCASVKMLQIYCVRFRE